MELVRAPSRLYTPGQVAFATVLGGPLAGGLLLAWNERRLKAPRRALAAAGGGLLATAALAGLGAFLSGAAASGLAVASIVAMHRVAAGLRSGRAAAEPETPGSWWAAAAVGAACFVLIVAAAVVIAVALGLAPRPD